MLRKGRDRVKVNKSPEGVYFYENVTALLYRSNKSLKEEQNGCYKNNRPGNKYQRV